MELPSEYLVPFYKVLKTDGGWNPNTAEYEEGKETLVEQLGILLPLSTDDFKLSEIGSFSIHDRKIYTALPLKEGSDIDFEGKRYTIYGEKDYSKQAEVYIYYAKRIGGPDD